MTNNFLDLREIEPTDLTNIISRGHELKQQRRDGKAQKTLLNKKMVMIFEKSSTRTRVSFEAGIIELGGHAINLSSSDMQLGRGETIADTARVLSGYVDIIMMRANDHNSLTELAKYAKIPIVNGLTDICHPCQIMADIITIEEHIGNIKNKKIAWIGDGNNVANSFIAAAVKFDFSITLATPNELTPSAEHLSWANKQSTGNIITTNSIEDAAKDADVIVTDTWVSMGDKDTERRIKLLSPYQVNQETMKLAKPNAIFMHCLPAHRGEEVTTEVIDGKQSVIWAEAENRMHAQKAILEWCLGV